MKTIQDVIQNNAWKSTSFLKSTEVNRLFNSGIVTDASDQAQSIIDAIDLTNVQDKVMLGLVDYVWAEQNLGNATNEEADALEAFFKEVHVKTFYGNQWWVVRTIQKDLMSTTKPNQLVLEKVGSYWATMYNKIISATVSGMSDIAEITIGDGLSNLSAMMVLNARKVKGDMGFGKLAKMYMNSTTLADQLQKQIEGTVTAGTIVEKYGKVTQVVNGVTQVIESDTPEYRYNGVTPIVIDDAMKDGIISMIEENAFAFTQKRFDNPLMYSNNPKAGNGAGKEEWGTKSLYILHPIGFDFIGVHGTNYASKSGLTIAELQGGGLYKLAVDPKLSPITNLKVKIGA